ncbi:hypothetical protein KIN20_003002 [Parelaphostrongylus tenuis]|uniref:Immunoglobulin I-set domain-containing protein n=1 Tax=Parelaphostrongylus tenuis TaxID=148309 RepID=A0AAD5QDB6_PARTN|nr:hypothetical protein KIN20_003002 [Parelaphostrongylus tenuis]
MEMSRSVVAPHVTVGQQATLICTVIGHPLPTIVWRNLGVEVKGEGQMMEIIDIQNDHVGVWDDVGARNGGRLDVPINADYDGRDFSKAVGSRYTANGSFRRAHVSRAKVNAREKGNLAMNIDNNLEKKFRNQLIP